MGDTTSIFLGILFGSIGTGYFIYGKKQQKAVPLISGILLMIVPYFISNNYVVVAVSLALMLAPKCIG